MSAESDPGQRYDFGMLPDSIEVRRFVELAHYAGGDLSPASAALHRAAELFDVDDIDTAGFLVDAAVVAYCRAFLHSNVRDPLDRHIEIPERFIGVHDAIRAYRNTTVAHSQSELSTTWPFVIIDREELDTPRVLDYTISQPLPWSIVQRFAELVDALLAEVETLTSALRRELEDRLRSGGPIYALAPELIVHARADADFTARTSRPPYPARQTLYWSHTTASLDP